MVIAEIVQAFAGFLGLKRPRGCWESHETVVPCNSQRLHDRTAGNDV